MMPLVDEDVTSEKLGVNKESVSYAVAATTGWLLAQQRQQDFRVVKLKGDTILERKLILLLIHLGRGKSALAFKCGHYLIEKQLPEGGWSRIAQRGRRGR
ncbi:MAG: hypothetical protein ABFC88_13260 [Thermoguttaceae bacterium]